MAARHRRIDERFSPPPRATKKPPKRNHGVSEDEWNQIVTLAMRGVSKVGIARLTGMTRRSIQRYFRFGAPHTPWGGTPIGQLVKNADEKTRAMRAALGEPDDGSRMDRAEAEQVDQQLKAVTYQEREQAKADALNARTQEAQLVKLARGNVVALAGAAVALVGPAQGLAKHIGEMINEQIAEKKVDPAKGLALLRQMSLYLKSVVETGHDSMEMERLLLGDPSGGNKLATDASNMTLDDAMTELGNAAKIHAAMTARGWTVHTGGGATLAPPPKQTGITLDAVSSVVTSTARAAEGTKGEGDADAAGAAAAPEESRE